MDLSTTPDDGDHLDDGDDHYGSGNVQRRSLSLREAIDELTQLRMVCIIYYTLMDPEWKLIK